MINKQNLWFITLFALILILGIYYISLPESTLPVFENTETKLDNAIKAVKEIIVPLLFNLFNKDFNVLFILTCLLILKYFQK